MIQDLIFTIGSGLFIISLLPTVFAQSKPHWSTSLLTAGVLTTYIGVMWSLALYWSALTTGITAVLWWILLAQELTNLKEETNE